MPQRFFDIEQIAISRARVGGEILGTPVLDDVPRFDDQHAWECPRLRNVVSHAEQRRVVPETTHLGEMTMALFAIESPERLIE